MSICFFAVPATCNQAAQQKHRIRQKPVCVLRFVPKQKSHFSVTRHNAAMNRRLATYNMKEDINANS